MEMYVKAGAKRYERETVGSRYVMRQCGNEPQQKKARRPNRSRRPRRMKRKPKPVQLRNKAVRILTRQLGFPRAMMMLRNVVVWLWNASSTS